MPGPGEGFRREDGVTWRGSGAPIFSATLPPYPLTQPPPPSPTLSPPPSPHLGMRSLQISQFLTQVPPGLRSARQLFGQARLFCLQLVFESLGEGLHAGVTMSGCAGGRPGVQEGGEQKRGQGEGSRGGHCSPEAVRPPPPSPAMRLVAPLAAPCRPPTQTAHRRALPWPCSPPATRPAQPCEEGSGGGGRSTFEPIGRCSDRLQFLVKMPWLLLHSSSPSAHH